ncbi:MAG: hypothetical protein K0R06_2917 [Clostridium sp.]|nr:hypothetical protein [Clostridium sp.]
MPFEGEIFLLPICRCVFRQRYNSNYFKNITIIASKYSKHIDKVYFAEYHKNKVLKEASIKVDKGEVNDKLVIQGGIYGI